MFSFSLKLRLKGLVLLTLLFCSSSYAQVSSSYGGCRAPSSSLISAIGLDSFVYYTPRPYMAESYIVRWNFVSNVKDSIAFKHPNIEGDFSYRLTDFCTDGVRFVFCFLDYVYVYTIKNNHLELQASEHFKKTNVEKCFFSAHGLVLVTSTSNNDGNERKIRYTTYLLEELRNISLRGSELSLARLKPSNYFAFYNEYLLWLKPVSQTLNFYINGELNNSKSLKSQFAPPNANLKRKLNKQWGLEGKMSIIMSELDSLEFDYLEEIYIIDGTAFVLFSAKGSGLGVKKPWNRFIAVLTADYTISERYLISNDVDIMKLNAFAFNKNLYFVENARGVLKVHSMYDICQTD